MVEIDKSKSVKKHVANTAAKRTTVDRPREFNFEVLLEFFAGMAWID